MRALRALRSRPSFAIAAIATLALGFGVNTAVFSLTRTVLLTPLPYRDADRLVQVNEVNAARGAIGAPPIAPANYAAWRDRIDAFERTAAFRRVSFNVATRSSALQVEGFQVAPAFFPMLGIEPARGRGIADEDARPGRSHVVIITDG